VLQLLAAKNAKATFFCVGENIQRHPDLFRNIINAGHAIGNHTYTHLNGWRTSTASYLENAGRCAETINAYGKADTKLFRPPYGKLTTRQYATLKKNHKIILWDVLTRDWEQDRTGDSCFQRVKQKAGPGSILVFHDSIKAKARMLPALEKTLEHFNAMGYRFESLTAYT
jgi:peptidoglycan/xylan/chitin deacetylase (PgdA/CDA1 family)